MVYNYSPSTQVQKLELAISLGNTVRLHPTPPPKKRLIIHLTNY
jgi:hypothetical protein